MRSFKTLFLVSLSASAFSSVLAHEDTSFSGLSTRANEASEESTVSSRSSDTFAYERRSILSDDVDSSSTGSSLIRRASISTVRCNNDKTCAVRARGVPKNGRAVCNSRVRRCRVVCRAGYYLKDGRCDRTKKPSHPSKPTHPPSDPTKKPTKPTKTPTKPTKKPTKPTKTSKPAPPKGLCGRTKCPSHPDHGYFHCVNNRKCVLSCSSDWTAVGNSHCIKTSNDPNNCGRAHRRCPRPYTSLGKAICTSGVCGIECPRFHVPAHRGSLYYCRRV